MNIQKTMEVPDSVQLIDYKRMTNNKIQRANRSSTTTDVNTREIGNSFL